MKTICKAVSAHILLGLRLENLTPIDQLPEGLTVSLHTGYHSFFGYRLGKKFYCHGGEDYQGMVSPSEFRRLTSYERIILEKGGINRE
jgi:hypothetical protein